MFPVVDEPGISRLTFEFMFFFPGLTDAVVGSELATPSRTSCTDNTRPLGPGLGLVWCRFGFGLPTDNPIISFRLANRTEPITIFFSPRTEPAHSFFIGPIVIDIYKPVSLKSHSAPKSCSARWRLPSSTLQRKMEVTEQRLDQSSTTASWHQMHQSSRGGKNTRHDFHTYPS